MCDRRERASSRPRPRWSCIVAILPLSITILTLIEVTVASSPLRTATEAVTVVATFGALGIWVRVNRAALCQLERCACASQRLTLRVIRSRPGGPARRLVAASQTVTVPVSAPAGPPSGARLGA